MLLSLTACYDEYDAYEEQIEELTNEIDRLNEKLTERERTIERLKYKLEESEIYYEEDYEFSDRN